MYNVLLSSLAAIVAFSLNALFLPLIAGIVPASIAFFLCFYFVSRRVGQRVEAEMSGLVALLKDRKVDEAKATLLAVKAKYSPWQPLLGGQLDAQIGLIDYMQGKFDEAMPHLQAGRFRNWQIQACIGAIEFRRGETDKALATLSERTWTSARDPLLFAIKAILAQRAQQNEVARDALAEGLKESPNHALLVQLNNALANKQKLDPKALGDVWFQIFPEEIPGARPPLIVQGKKGGPAEIPGGAPAPTNRKMRRAAKGSE